MRSATEALQVVVGPQDKNPWSLPVSSDPMDWGVSLRKAEACFSELVRTLGTQAPVSLAHTRVNAIANELYEDTILELAADGGIIGLGFDFAELHKRSNRSSTAPSRQAHHLVRLTPIGSETRLESTILAPQFGFDYEGPLVIFDDSGEMTPEELLVQWRPLLAASRAIDGALWTVKLTR